MLHRLLAFARMGRILLVFALFAALISTASAFVNGQTAELVLGQPDFTSSAAATTASGMTQPREVAIDPTSGKIFISDYSNNRILRFASSAALANGDPADGVFGQPNFITSTSSASATATNLSSQAGLVVDSAGRLWVADYGNSRVLRYDAAASKTNGAAADGVLGQPGFVSKATATTASGMSLPGGVAVDSAGTLWVSESPNNRVLRFDNAAAKANGAAADGVLGQPDFVSLATTTTASGMRNPGSVAVDSAGHLWVADYANNRVLRFDNAAAKANGAAADGVLGQPGFISNATPLTASGLSQPAGAAVDSAGTVWVADFSNRRVLSFDNAASKANGAAADGVLGQPNFTSNTAATTASGMHEPFGVAVDSSGHLWVADAVNNRVLRFGPLPQTITFGALAAKIYGAVSFSLSATASSSLVVIFTSSTPTVCTVSGATLTIVSVGTCTIAADQAGDTNYTVAPQVAQSFTVSPAPLTITANDKTKFVGTANPALTVSYAGFVNGDAASSLTAAVSLATTAVTGSAVGDYPITASGAANANYAISFVAGTLTVTAKQVPVITWATPATITYGTVLSDAQLNAIASVPGTLSYLSLASTLLDAGNSQSLRVIFTPTDGDTFAAIETSVSIDVLPAPLTITADHKQKGLGAANPTLTASYSGFVNGDTAASLDAPAVLTTAATTNSPLGTYTITVSGAADPNYAITFVTGTLTVTHQLYLPVIKVS